MPSGDPIAAPTLAYRSERVRLYQGDATAGLSSVMPDGPAVVLTDPPYVAYGHIEAVRRAAHLEASADSGWTAFVLLWVARWWSTVLRSAEDGGAAWVFTSPHYAGAYLRLTDLLGSCAWRGAWPCGPTELVLGHGAVRTDGLAAALAHNTYGQDKSLHTLGALLRATEASPDLPVVDPFCGGGHTLIAALRAGRSAIGVELREETCARAVRRVSHYERTGEVIA